MKPHGKPYIGKCKWVNRALRQMHKSRGLPPPTKEEILAYKMRQPDFIGAESVKVQAEQAINPDITPEQRMRKQFDRKRNRIRDALIRRDGKLCMYCRNIMVFDGNPSADLFATVEHILPISKGGTNDFDNLGLACNRCNHLKEKEARGVNRARWIWMQEEGA